MMIRHPTLYATASTFVLSPMDMIRFATFTRCRTMQRVTRTVGLFYIEKFVPFFPEKCPAWTKNSVVRQSAKHIRNQQWTELLDLIKQNEVTSGYADVIDDIIYKFGTLHQPIFDRDDDGFSGKTDHPLGKLLQRGRRKSTILFSWWRTRLLVAWARLRRA